MMLLTLTKNTIQQASTRVRNTKIYYCTTTIVPGTGSLTLLAKEYVPMDQAISLVVFFWL